MEATAMEIRQLKYFLSVAKHLSFTKAAEECFVVQTTITHQISALERELGVKLFERNNHSVIITEYGKSFYRQAASIVSTANVSIAKIKCLQNNYQYFLNIGYWGNIFSRFMPQILQEFRERYPNVQVVLHQKNAFELMDMLEKGLIDIIISYHLDAWDGLSWIVETEILEDELYFLFSKKHPLAGQKFISVSQLAHEPILTFSGVNAEDLKARYQREGCAANIVQELEDHQSIIYLVESGYGVTLCAFESIPLENPNIAYARIIDEGFKVKLVLYQRRYARNEAISWFRNILNEYDFNLEQKNKSSLSL